MEHKRNLAKLHKNRKYLPAKQVPKVKKLPDNFDRYSEGGSTNLYLQETGEDLVGLGDFHLNLSLAPAHFFQFKQEKVFIPAKSEDRVEINKLFEIDIEALEQSLSTIPFYERCNIDKNIFTDFQIKLMDNEAGITTILDEMILNDVVSPQNSDSSDSEASSKGEVNEEQELEEWLDDILN